MIAVTLRFDEDAISHISGEAAGQYVLQMLKEQPKLAVDAARQVDVWGPWGKITETR